MSLFHSPLGLFEFQAEGVAQVYWAWTESEEPVRLALWDTGIGKTVLALAVSALAFEDDMLDVVLVVAEANKIKDWAEDDAPRFTDLSVGLLAGKPLPQRKNTLAKNPQLLITSWETGRNDIVKKWTPSKRGVAEDGILLDHLKGKRVAVIFDEFSSLRKRGTAKYIAWEHLVKALRKETFKPWLLGLTATTVATNPMDHFNACRILSPERAGRVEDFEPQYVSAYDLYGNPIAWQFLTPAETPPGVMPLSSRFAPITLRKKKTDPDVIDQFPAKMENSPTMVDLDPDHKRLYDEIESIFSDENISDAEQRQGFGLLRLLANHPRALFDSKSKYAAQVIENVGYAYLDKMACAKVTAMLEWQQSMTTQQTVIFSFFGNAVVPRLAHALEAEGYKISLNTGSMSTDARQQAKAAYIAGDTQIFLSSDAGAKGLNLGCGSALLHYETPLTYETYMQRSDRIHRIDSKHPSVTIDMLIARDTLEYPLAHVMLKRNLMAEKIQDGDPDATEQYAESAMSARDRIAMLRRAKRL